MIVVLMALATQETYAQSNTGTTQAQKRYQRELNRKDSILNAVKLQRTQDSIARALKKQQMLAYRDSVKKAMVEKRKQDSIKREEVKLQMLAERQRRDSIQKVERAKLQAQIAQRKKAADSLRAARKVRTDSLALVRAEARRVREALKKYRNSKGYKDSIALVRQVRRDSIKNERDERLAKIKAKRQHKLDSTKNVRTQLLTKLKAERKRVMDSTLAARKNYIDSIKSVRKKQTEALKLARKKRKDSLDKERSSTKLVIKKQKTETELLKEKADKIHARKQGSWTNEKLLKKKWNIKRRIWQNTVTRYNAYYNAKRKYDDAIRLLEDRYKESYTEQIPLQAYDLESSLSAVGSEMDTVIKKCAYDTHIHDPRSKWFDNLYLLMGKAFFHKNDYDGAITAFQYVVNEYKDGDKSKQLKRGFEKLPELDQVKFDKDNKVRLATEENRGGLKTLAHHAVRNEALIWLARSYAKNQQFSEAQSLLSILEEDKMFPDRLRDELYIALAEMHMEQGNKLSAIEPLVKALKQKHISKSNKNRVSYLLAQLYAQDGDFSMSNKYFKEALKAKLPIEMEYFTKLNLAQNAINGSGNKEEAIGNLESLAKEDKFEKWKAQSYLSLGQILQATNPDRALKQFDASIKAPNNQNLRAAAFLGKAEIYYKRAQYKQAKVAYDSVVIFAKKAQPTLSNMDVINLRKEVLESLIEFTGVISKEDSLQLLSRKSEKEKIAVIKKDLRRQAKEEKERLKAESAKLTAVSLTPGKFNKNAWYFYKNTSVQSGLVDFKIKWGDRPLRDNWRRGGNEGLGNLLAGGDSTNEEQNNKATQTKNAAVRKMLAALYSSPNDFKQSDDKIKDAYFQLGLLYSSRLQEYASSIQTFEAMNLRYAKHDRLAATYYSMYLSHQKLKNTTQVAALTSQLKKEFPQSKYTALVSGQQLQENDKNKELVIQYDSTYQMLQRAEYANVLRNATVSLNNGPETDIRSKFELLLAKSLAGLKNYDSSIIVTEGIIKNYPGTDQQQHAQDFLRFIKKASKNNSTTTNATNSESTKRKKKDPNAIYTLDKDEEHFYFLYLTKIDGNTLALKAAFSDYNVIKHSRKKLKTNMNLITAKTGTLTIVQFPNAAKADKYAKQAHNERKLFSKVNGSDFKEMTISKSNFKELLKTRKIAEYLRFYKDNY